MGVITQELSWFGKVSNRFATAKDDAVTEESAFDLADAMERGFAAAPLASYVTEVGPMEGKAQELTVHRSQDRTEHTLVQPDGDGGERPLMVAKAAPAGERRIDLFSVGADGSSPRTQTPAFRLTHSADNMVWELQGGRCESCEYRSPASRSKAGGCGRRILLRIEHERCSIGPGFAMCMNIEAPPEGEVWCSSCGVCSSAENLSPKVASKPVPAGGLSLASRKPRWSARLKTLTLEFRGRCSQASSKNFQLAVGANAATATHDAAVLQFGKMKPDDFALDFKGPLCPLTAFAAALTTAFWK